MDNIDTHLQFVKEQIAFHEGRAASLKGQEWRKNIHLETAAKFVSLLSFLNELSQRDNASVARAKASVQLQLNLDDIQGLPDELIQELNISTGDKTEFAILNVIEDAGGIISLDKLLVGVYKRTGEIHKRASMLNRLYRMIQKGVLFSVPSKKGVYSTEEMTVEQVEALLNRTT